MSIRHSMFWLLAAALPLAAQRQSPDTARVSPIVVSATRLPMALGALPVAVTVILGEDLRLRGIATVADALNGVTSAYLAQSGSQGGTTSLFLRGGESKYVKVLIDGVPANDPGGVYDFASLTTDNVERIEVVRGPVSVVYGADAVTGVVHIITRPGAGPQRVQTDVRVGTASRGQRAGAPTPKSVRTWDATTSLSGALSSGSYSVAVARHYSSGLYELNNRYLNNVLSARFVFSPRQGTDVRLSLRYNDYQFNYPTNSAGDVSDSNAFRSEDRTVIGVEVERQLSSRARTVLTLNSSVNDGGTDDGMDAAGNSFVSQDKVRRRGAEWRLHWLPGAHAAITVGAQLEQQDQRSQSQSQSPFGPFYSVFRAARRNMGTYAEALLTPSDRLTVTIGARIDDNEKFGQFATGRAGVSWRPFAATRLRGTVGTAFREPSFFENYATGFVTGNPALEPERTRSADVGIEQEILRGRAQLALTGFMQRFRDMIDYTGANACGFSYCNVAAAESNGLEVELRGRLAGPVSAAVGGTLLHTRVATPGYDATPGGLYRLGESLIRRPGQKWTAEVTYRGTGPLSASVRVLAVGARPDRDFHFPATPVTLPAYQRVDVGSEYVLWARSATRTSVTLRVENLLAEQYENIFNFLAPRRTSSIGVRTSF